MRPILSTLGVAAALLAVSGCCEPQCAPQLVAYPSVVMPLLSDGEPACPPPHMMASRPASQLRVTGKPEELVYDLGEGLVANSSAVTLAGGRAAPLARYRQGGVGCAMAKPQNPSRSSAPAVRAVLPAPNAPVAPLPATGMVYGACPVPEGSEQVCLPGEFMSECFTLTDAGKQGGPAIYIPDAFSKYDARLDETSPIEPAVLPAASTAGITPAAAVPAEPASTSAIPAAPGVEPADRMSALKQVESLEKTESPLAAPVPAPEVAPTTTAPLAPPVESTDPVAVMPPVPVVSDLNQVAENMTPTLGDPSNLPEVVLPPKLN